MSEEQYPSNEADAHKLELSEEQQQYLESFKRAFRDLAITYLNQFKTKEEAKIYPLADQIIEKVEVNQKMIRMLLITTYSNMLILTRGLDRNLGHFYMNTLTALDPEDKFIDAYWHIDFLNDVTHFLAQRTIELRGNDLVASDELCVLTGQLRAKTEDVLS